MEDRETTITSFRGLQEYSEYSVVCLLEGGETGNPRSPDEVPRCPPVIGHKRHPEFGPISDPILVGLALFINDSRSPFSHDCGVEVSTGWCFFFSHFVLQTRTHKYHAGVEYPIESSGVESTSSVGEHVRERISPIASSQIKTDTNKSCSVVFHLPGVAINPTSL